MREQITEALDQGYTPEEIFDHLSKKEELLPKFKEAQEAGYSPSQIVEYLKTKPTEKEQDVAKDFKMFGWKPKPETIAKIRPKIGVQLKAIAKGTGTWGNIAQIPENVAALITQKAGGRGDVVKAILHEMIPGAKLPTSEEMGDYFQKLSGEKFEPKTESEKLFSNITENTIGNLSIGLPLTFAARGAATGQTLKNIGEGFNLPDWMNTGLELTGNVLGSSKYKGLGKYTSDLYSNVTKNLPTNATVNTEKLSENLSKIKNSLIKTGLQKEAAAPKKKVVNVITEILGKIKNGKINIKDAWDTRKDIYKLLGPNYKEVEGYKNILKDVNYLLNQTLKGTKTTYPDFYENLIKADKFFGDAAKFQGARSFIDTVKEAEKFAGGLAVLEGQFDKIPKIYLLTKGLSKASDILKNPRILKYYASGIKAAATQNKYGVISAAKAIEEEMQKQVDKTNRHHR